MFITGLSAGGAMTSVMLACYPDLFAAGAIIAGLPFASANNLPEALERMRGQGSPARYELAARLRAASGRDLDQPAVSVWHGSQDRIVAPCNATAIVDQWLDAHGLGERAGNVDTVEGHRRETWRDARRRILVERYDIGGMGHGTPLDTRDGEACGTVGPHMLEAGICSTRVIAASWGLIAKRAGRSVTAQIASNAAEPPTPANHVGAVIEDALRAAGLMR
jgi:poly(3-hydroxybutyrate) depolymerase